MNGFSTDIEAKTLDNEFFRKVLYTAPHVQLVVMTLRPGENIGMEKHDHGDQFIRVEAGKGEAIIDGESHALFHGFAVVIPAGAMHDIVNTGSEPMRLYTIYSPPEHADGTVHPTKADAAHEHDHTPAH